MRRHLAPAALLLALAPRLCLAAGAGSDPFNFLFLDANARAVGMGGAYTALATDANALLYNPAGLAARSGHEATFMHNQYLQGVSQDYAGLSLAQGLGASLNYLRSGDVPRTTISNPDGTGLASASMTDLALSAGYGLRLGSSLRLGAAGKLIRQTIDDFSTSAYGLDLGAMWLAPALEGLSLGLAVQNIGPDVRGQGVHERMPTNVRLGGAYAFPLMSDRAVVALDVSKERSETPVVAVGAELVVADVLPVRLGFNTRSDDGMGMTFGVGWKFRKIQLDYAFAPYKDLGSAHRISMTFRWGEPGASTRAVRRPSEPPARRPEAHAAPEALPAAQPQPLAQPAPQPPAQDATPLPTLPLPATGQALAPAATGEVLLSPATGQALIPAVVAPALIPATTAQVLPSTTEQLLLTPTTGQALPPPATGQVQLAPPTEQALIASATGQALPEPVPAPAPAAAAAAQADGRPVVAQVRVLGLQKVPEREVRALLSVREGAPYPVEDKTKDIAALQASPLFSAANIIEVPLTPAAVRVDIAVFER